MLFRSKLTKYLAWNMGSYKGFLFLCSASVLIYRIEVVKKTIILFRLYEIAKGRKVITKLFSCQQRNKYLVKSMKNKSEIFKKIREYLGLSQKAMGKSWDVPLRKSDGARNRIDRLESGLHEVSLRLMISSTTVLDVWSVVVSHHGS